MTGLCDKFLSDEIDKDSFYDGLKGYLNHYYENRYELRNQPGSVREKSNDIGQIRYVWRLMLKKGLE